MSDSDISQRSRLDEGRILALIPYGLSCLTLIQIDDGRRIFSVLVVKDFNLVVGEWLVRQLGLEKEVTLANSNSIPKRKTPDELYNLSYKLRFPCLGLEEAQKSHVEDFSMVSSSVPFLSEIEEGEVAHSPVSLS
ncbi:hypothetical protein Q3G72_013011 [Acer saccharum]|nr:hypothetical protein Q3G72_013011 [Acer saccharum]